MAQNQLPGQISLEDYLSNYDPAPWEDDYFIPAGDDAAAATMLRELGSLEKRISKNEQTAEAEIAKINAWRESVNEPLANQAKRLRQQLEAYAEMERREDPERKTISTPYGVIKSTPAQPKWEVDDATFLPWAKAQDDVADLYRVKETPALSVIKGAFDYGEDGSVINSQTGEAIPGVWVVQPSKPFNVTVKPRI